jgi:hypothetical protein
VTRLLRHRLTIAVACAIALLSAQVLGLHYHRHVSGPHHGHATAADIALATTWDPGEHVPAAVSTASGPQATATVHADDDLDIDVQSDAAPKFKKGMALAAILVPAPWESSDPGSREQVRFLEAPDGRPQAFRLKPPSQAPPCLLS